MHFAADSSALTRENESYRNAGAETWARIGRGVDGSRKAVFAGADSARAKRFSSGAGDWNRARMASFEDLVAIKVLTCINADLWVLGDR